MKTKMIITLITTLMFILLLNGVSASIPDPCFPDQYYGNITINGQGAQINTQIRAVANNSVIGDYTTKIIGVYGVGDTTEDKFTINCLTRDATITFKIFNNGAWVDSAQTATCMCGGYDIQLSLSLNINASAEVCNGIDDDYDGLTDEGGNSLCSDNQYCNGNEICSGSGGCVLGTSINCSAYNLPAINSCDYNPDNNPFTLDMASSFTSSCNEATDSCTQNTYSLTHLCNKNTCGAECVINTDCPPTDCDVFDGCVNGAHGTYHDYYPVLSSCSGCSCVSGVCNDFDIISTDIDHDGFDVECDNDCNDNNAAVYLGAQEICDGLDNDCDATVDESCTCLDSDHDSVCDSSDSCIGQNQTNLPASNSCVTNTFNMSNGCHITNYKTNGFVINYSDCDYLDDVCKDYTDTANTCNGVGGINYATCNVVSYQPNGYVVNTHNCDSLDSQCRDYTTVNDICDGSGNRLNGTCGTNYNNQPITTQCGSDHNVYGCYWGNGLDADIGRVFYDYHCDGVGSCTFNTSSATVQQNCSSAQYCNGIGLSNNSADFSCGGCSDMDQDAVCDTSDSCVGQTLTNLPINNSCVTYNFNMSNGCHITDYKTNGHVVNIKNCDSLDTQCRDYTSVTDVCDGNGNRLNGTCGSAYNNQAITTQCGSDYNLYGCYWGNGLDADIGRQFYDYHCDGVGSCTFNTSSLAVQQNCSSTQYCNGIDTSNNSADYSCGTCANIDNDEICDSNDNLVGDSSDVETNGLCLRFEINGLQVNNSFGMQPIQIKDCQGQKLVEFDYNFSLHKFDLRNIILRVNEFENENESSSSILVNGIDLEIQNSTKTVYLRNLTNQSSICIKDDNLTNISQITAKCNAIGEFGVMCPGVNGKYNCSFTDSTNTTMKITGLSHSAVQQQGYCGDGIIQTGEECESSNLNGNTCATFGFNTGSLSCNSCTLVKTGCSTSGGGSSGGSSSGGSSSGGSTVTRPQNTTNTTNQVTPTTPTTPSQEDNTPSDTNTPTVGSETNTPTNTQNDGLSGITGQVVGDNTWFSKNIWTVVIALLIIAIIGAILYLALFRDRTKNEKVVSQTGWIKK